ncbi:34018_t:CDS:1, partial [Gigaspora margarita]
ENQSDARSFEAKSFFINTFVIAVANAFNAMAAPVPDEMNPDLVIRDA